MSSNKHKRLVFLFGILFSACASFAFLLLCLRSGNTVFYAKEITEAWPTSIESSSVQVTVHDTTYAENSAEEVTAVTTEETTITESSIAVTTITESSGAIADEGYTETGAYMFFAYSDVLSGNPKKDRILLLFFLLSALVFLGTGVFIFRREKMSAGIETASFLFSLGFILLSFFPSRIAVYLPRSQFYENSQNFNLFSFTLKYNITITNLLLFLMVYIAFSCIFFSLREFSGCLFSEKKEDWLLIGKFLNRRYPDRDHPQKKVTLSIVFLVISALLLFISFSAGLMIYFRQIRIDISVFRAVWRCVFSAFLFIILMVSSSLVLKRNMDEMATVHEEALERAVKNEHLRVDLIANVSHDLRTPLTSILGYGDLLKREEMTPEGQEHLALLNQKADYMKDLVDSLFELTKVASGVLKSEKKPLDLIKLLEQTMGMLEDELSESALFVKRHYVQDSVVIESDGQFLNRIFMNLFGNAIKYSLTGTRIHVFVSFERPYDKTSSGECVLVRITNTASYEMDFDEEEILERFVRGDKSRTTKGSGIGLAIAKTYTEALNGKFSVNVDGDQFNALVYLPKV